MSTTWDNLFTLVFRDSGVFGTGQTPEAQDALDMKQRCNYLLNQWRRRRWLVFHLVELSTVCDGSLFYTIGDGQTFDVTRPDMIDFAFARQVTQAVPNQPDYPMRLIHSYEEYSQIALKRLQAGPSWSLFYDSGYPVGKLYPYPLMSDQYELHIGIKAELTEVGELTDVINMPPEYEYALYMALMNRARSAYRLKPDPYLIGQEKAALETLRAANYQISSLVMPAAVRSGGGYNIWSDSFGPSNR